ncbi:MAG TPA: circadian clock protein KaiC [Candidatus Angelobacter sp.]|nr:circadian clock protein KaiC [Candidatus Angelobacter sp.]
MVTRASGTLLKTIALPRVPTGNAGFDQVLRGGLPQSRTTLFSGGPGTGKSILGLEFLVRGTMAGEPGVLVVFEERPAAIRANALTLGWDLAALEQRKLLLLIDGHIDYEMTTSGSFDLKGLLSIVEGAAREIKAERLVFDAIDVLLRYFNDSAREREQLFLLNDWLVDHKFTSVLTVKRGSASEANGHYEFLDYLADCVVHMDQRVREQVTTRRLRVIKYRGSDYGKNEYPYIAGPGGLKFIPLSGAELRHKPLGPPVTSGSRKLDEILGGGYPQGCCVLISGPSGTGKTTLSSVFACAAAKRKEKVLFIGFEESIEALVGSMLSSGTDLRPSLKSGILRSLTAMPETMGIEEHLVRVVDVMREFSPQHVVLDAISAVRRTGAAQASFDFLVRLITVCRESGITLLVVNQTDESGKAGDIAGQQASSLVDTIVALRYIESGGETNRIIDVVKSRGMHHSNQLREFRITNHGVDIAEVYASGGGVLTGTARVEKEAEDDLDLRRAEAQMAAKKAEVNRRKAELEAETARLQAALGAAEIEVSELEIEAARARENRAARMSKRREGGNART